jgi:integrase
MDTEGLQWTLMACYVARMLHDGPTEPVHPGPQKGSTRRGFGRLRKLPSGRWQAAYTGPDARVHPAPSTFHAQDAARDWLNGEKKLIDLDVWAPPAERVGTTHSASQSFGDFAEEWLATRTTRRGEPLKPRTHSEYRRYLDLHILPAFATAPLRSLTPSRVKLWYESLDVSTPTARAHAYQLMRALCTTATEQKLLPGNPCQIAGAGSVTRAKRIRPAEISELMTIMDSMPERLRLAIVLGAWCALRYGEIAELRRSDIDLDHGLVRVQRGVTWPNGVATVGSPKSLAGNRDVHIPAVFLPLANEHLSKHTGPAQDALLFPAAEGRHMHPRTFGKRFDTAREAAGRPDLTFHALRHTGAVLAAQSGATLADLMARLGHSTPNAAMRYQHAASDRDRAIAEALSEQVRRLPPRH